MQEKSVVEEPAKPSEHKEQHLREAAAARFKDGKLLKEQLRKLQRAR